MHGGVTGKASDGLPMSIQPRVRASREPWDEISNRDQTLKASDARRSRHRSEELRRGGRDSCKKKGALRQAKTGDPMVFEKPV